MDFIRIRTWVAIAVVCVWSLAAVIAFFTKNFEELGIITPVMMIVTGFIFGYRHEYIMEDAKNTRMGRKHVEIEDDEG